MAARSIADRPWPADQSTATAVYCRRADAPWPADHSTATAVYCRQVSYWFAVPDSRFNATVVLRRPCHSSRRQLLPIAVWSVNRTLLAQMAVGSRCRSPGSVGSHCRSPFGFNNWQCRQSLPSGRLVSIRHYSLKWQLALTRAIKARDAPSDATPV